MNVSQFSGAVISPHDSCAEAGVIKKALESAERITTKRK